MKFNPITISKDEKIRYSFYPKAIAKVAINNEMVVIWEYQDDGDWVETEIYKKDYDYPAWEYFLLQLRRTFEL